MATFEEVKAMLGKTSEEKMTIEPSMVRAFCNAIGDTNPRWQKEVPTGYLTNANVSSGIGMLGIPMPYKRMVAAGADWEFYKPIMIGDTITTTHEFKELLDKSSEKGVRALLISHSRHVNQKGELVALSIGKVMSY